MNKIFKFAIVSLLCCTYSIHALGQEIYVKSPITLLPTDLTASKYEHWDATGNPCAVIKVQLPSSPNISFSGAVGEVEQNAGEYIVYVSPGISALNVLREGSLVCTIGMNGEEILPKCTYQVVLAMKREQIFKVTPTDAKIVVDDEELAVDAMGNARMNCEEGKMYTYIVSVPGYQSISDKFMISPNETEVRHINKNLVRKTSKVKFVCNSKKIEVFADEEHIEKEKDGTYKIPVGTHTLLVTSNNYNDWTEDIYIPENEEEPLEISISFSEYKDVSNHLRTRYEGYIMAGIVSNDNNVDDAKSHYNYNVGLGFAFEIFLARWVTFRPSIEFMYFPFEKNDDDTDIVVDKKGEQLGNPQTYSIDLPLVFSANFPLGRLNRFHLSLGAGPIIGVGSRTYEILSEDGTRATRAISYSSSSSDDKKDKTYGYFLYGGRISAQLSLGWFVVGANLDIRKYTKNMFDKTLIMPMLVVGFKL